jgi:hypothetical protein
MGEEVVYPLIDLPRQRYEFEKFKKVGNHKYSGLLMLNILGCTGR